MKSRLMVLISMFLILAGCRQQKVSYEATLPSPDFNIHLYFNLFNGNPYYMVFYGKEKVLAWSVLGFRLEDGNDLTKGMSVTDETDQYEDITGMQQAPFFEDVKYNSLTVYLSSAQLPAMGYAIDFRTFNGGIAFRYRFDSQRTLNSLAPYEVSEFGFDPSLGNWSPTELQDSLAGHRGKEFMVPLELVFARGRRIAFLETGGDPALSMKIVMDPDNDHLFRVDQRDMDTMENLDGGPPATAWRILLINNTNQNE